jgi:hypothetical protein
MKIVATMSFVKGISCGLLATVDRRERERERERERPAVELSCCDSW